MAYGDSPMGRLAMAQALRRDRSRDTMSPQGGTPASAPLTVDTSDPNGGGPAQQQQSPISGQTINNMAKYMNALGYGGGATQAAGQAAMPEMMAGGGSNLGSMGLMQAPVSFPGAPAAGGAGGASGGAGLGGLGAGGGLAGLAALGYLTDKEMNESKGSIINADKLNEMGTIGDSGIGLRGGDLVNGFNPATWLSDPKKAAKGLGNAFTFGLLDKIF